MDPNHPMYKQMMEHMKEFENLGDDEDDPELAALSKELEAHGKYTNVTKFYQIRCQLK